MMTVMLSQAAMTAGRYLATVAESLLNALDGLLREWRYRSDIHKLQSLSDRQLSDIGLTRGRIESAVRGGAAGETLRNAQLGSQLRS